MIADIEDRLSGRVPFSLGSTIRRIHQAELDTYIMAQNLDRLSPRRYGELFTALRKISGSIDLETAAHSRTIQGPSVIPIADLNASATLMAGSKMAILGEIKNVLGAEVPDGFVVTTAAFYKFMGHEGLLEQASRLEEVLEIYGEKVAEEACRKVQQAIIDSPIPGDLQESVLAAFDKLTLTGRGRVAMRSSAVGEDGTASHAGQYFTELNVGRDLVLDSYRWVVASSYGIGAVMYRLKQGLTQKDALMAVGCVEMIEPRCSGVIFSRDFNDPQADRVVISVSQGLSEAGSGRNALLEEITFSPSKDFAGRSSMLGEAELQRLANMSRFLERHFGRPQDTEWAIDRSGKLYTLQSRPMTTPANPPASEFPGIISGSKPIITGGYSACPGIGAGPVFIVATEDDLSLFPDNGVLVSPHSSPKYSLVMNRCAAIVTERGSPIGHMAILSREYNVPTIVGLNHALDSLENGRVVTIDATSTAIYDGQLTLSSGKVIVAPVRAESPAARELLKIARWVTPLNLIDTASSEFSPANCRTLHDVMRFVHEKLFEAMFYLGDRAAISPRDSMVLEGNLPFVVYVLDVGGGLKEMRVTNGRVAVADVDSVPMKSFLQGLTDTRIKWNRPRLISARGFISVLGESIAGSPAESRGVGRACFAIVSDRYMNFSTKAGYHFNTIDTYCGRNINKNYIHFRFEGGAAAEVRRGRRCQFLYNVLNALDFKVQCRGDVMTARLEKHDCDTISARLADLGRLTLCSRQLDMLMDSDDSPEFFSRAFLKGDFGGF